jgi:glycosyltransferase involved in cell wall biosynthesis
MSNEMPYKAIRFRELDDEQIDLYLRAWRCHIAAAMRAFRPNVVHVHHTWLLAALVASRWPSMPLVVSVHGTDLQRALECPRLADLVRPWLSRFDRMLLLTRDCRDLIRRAYGPVDYHGVELGNGFDPCVFRPGTEAPVRPHPVRGLLETDGDRIIATAAKYDPQKGIEWLIRALAEVRRVGHDDVVLAIAGGGSQRERARYEALASELDVLGHVRFLNVVPQKTLAQLLRTATTFALPAVREPFGLVLLEALACGCPVIATDKGGPRYFIPRSLAASGEAIFVPGLTDGVPPQDERVRFVGDLAAAISQHLDRPTSRRRRLAVADAVSGLTWDRYVSRLANELRIAAGVL